MGTVSPEDEDMHPAPTGRGFMAYPASTLSPVIRPTDLTTFKTRGIGTVTRDVQQKIRELHKEYRGIVDEFNWNKLVYESRFQFEPVVGRCYHLYSESNGFFLSMIGPSEWSRRFVGTFELGFNGRWIRIETAPDFHLDEFLSGKAPVGREKTG